MMRDTMLFGDFKGGDDGAGQDDEHEHVIEVIPVGRYGPQPEVDDPIYYKAGVGKDGKTMQVGPFDLSGRNFREWADSVTSNDLDEMVQQRALRASTAMTVKSAQFRTVVDMLEHGQKPKEDVIRRILPGDLQRAVEDFRKKQEG